MIRVSLILVLTFLVVLYPTFVLINIPVNLISVGLTGISLLLAGVVVGAIRNRNRY